MIEENSGYIYRFPLDLELGFVYCELVDFTDISNFNGRVLYVFKLIEKLPDNTSEIDRIKDSGIMFGPTPIFKNPNIKGKGNWKLIGKSNNYVKTNPIFKSTRSNYTKKDWSSIGLWYKLYDFTERSEEMEYEKVRGLEMPVLYNMQGVQIKTTMYILMNEGKNINNYYDLNDFYLRCIYIEIANTYFSKDKTTELLKLIK